MIIYLL